MKLDSLNDFVLMQMTAPLRMALEARAPWEHGAGLAAQPLLAMLPKGDGHPVLVLPLMFGNDLSTVPLRSFLDARGYAASAWDLGVNLGPRAGVFDACLGRLRALRESHGRPVSLIGWSLGGLFAFTIHSVFLARGREEFRAPVSLFILWATLWRRLWSRGS